MTASHWYKVLLEKNITTKVKLNGKNENRTAKIEMKFPQIEWTRTWEYMRTRGLEGEQTSFLLKVLYNILPTRERLHRMRFEESPLCKLCNANAEDSLEHSLLECSFNPVNDWKIAILIDIDSNLLHYDLTSSNIQRQNFSLAPSVRLSVVWFLASVLSLVWKARVRKKRTTLSSEKAQLLAEVALLKLTKYQQTAQTLELALKFITCSPHSFHNVFYGVKSIKYSDES